MASILNLQTVGDIYLVSVTADPAAGAGTKLPNGDAVPVGSIAFADIAGVGRAFMKFGIGDTDWQPFDMSDKDWQLTGNLLTGSDPINPNEFFGSNNDFDVVFKRNGLEAMRFINAGGNAVLSQGYGPATVNTSNGIAHQNLLLNLADTATPSCVKNVEYLDANFLPRRFVEKFNLLRTTNATPLVMTPAYVIEENKGLIQIKLNITAVCISGGTSNRVANYQRSILARKLTEVAAYEVRQINSDVTFEDTKAWDIAITGDATGVHLAVTGEAATTIDWSVQSEITVLPNV